MSEAALRNAVRAQPDNARAWFDLGQVLAKTPQTSESIRCIEHAVRLSPRQPQFNIALGQALQSIGQLDQAIECYRRALGAKPDASDVYVQLGVCLRKRDQGRQAIACFEQAIEHDPDNTNALMHLGWAYLDAPHPDRAVAVLGRANTIDPNSPQTHLLIGQGYAQLAQYDKARAAYARALELDPGLDSAHAGMVRCLISMGRDEDAEREINRVLHAAGVSHEMVCEYARLMRRKNAPLEAIETITQIVERESYPPRSRSEIDFALGALYEDLEKYHCSFAHYRRANDAVRPSFDPAPMNELIALLREVFDPGRFHARPRGSSQLTRPVFIVGMPRSGTSLVEQILASHPNVFGAGELSTIHEIAKSFPAEFGLTKAYPKAILELTSAQLDELAARYLDDLRERDATAKHVTDKMPENRVHLGFIHLMFPNARFIHCLRDPLDNCFSCYATSLQAGHAYAYDPDSIAFIYRTHENLMSLWRELFGESILTVRYENLVRDPESQVRRLLDMCNLEWDDRCLAFHESKRKIATASVDQVSRPMYDSSIGRAERFGEHVEPLREALRKHGTL